MRRAFGPGKHSMTLQLSQLVHRLDHAMRRCTAHSGRIVLALGVLGIVSSAKADIALFASPESPISAAPDFIAAADFNGDGNTDVAALESGSDTINLVYGTNDGALGPSQGVPMAPRLLGFAAGDLNSDDIPDLVGVTNYLDSVYIAIGKGDGTFQSRIRYQVGQHPVAVAIGNLDRMNGN